MNEEERNEMMRSNWKAQMAMLGYGSDGLALTKKEEMKTPNRETVIKGLECCSQMSGEFCRKCPYEDECKEESLAGSAHLAADALTLLQESDAIEPQEQEETRIWTVCGNCSQHLISKWLWCSYCGRKIKWND